jgi:hypothetical protein
MHTALGHMVAIKKKGLLLVTHEMSQKEISELVAARSETTTLGGMKEGDFWSRRTRRGNA